MIRAQTDSRTQKHIFTFPMQGLELHVYLYDARCFAVWLGASGGKTRAFVGCA